MTRRTDMVVVDHLSPRLITLLNTATSMTVQDLHDTAADWEDELHLGMDHDSIVDSAGKEDLGGGVLVGITSSLLNTQLEFEARTTPVSTGTATSTGTTTLTDSAGTFQTDGIIRGDIIINFTDFSMAAVISVDSETVIQHRVLTGGTNNDWTSSDVYRIYNIVQIEIAGGNLVATDSVGDPIPAILPSFGTQIVRTSSSSSTITEIEANTYLSAGGIHIDVNNGFAGTAFPTGTPTRKSNNVPDAFTIANKFGLQVFIIYSNIVIPVACPDWTFQGGINEPIINFNGQDVDGSLFKGVNLTGTMQGAITATNCICNSLVGMDGFFRKTSFDGTNTVAVGSAIVMDRCFSRVPGTGVPILDMGAGNASDGNIRAYSGGIELRNVDQATDNISIDFISGHAKLTTSCTDGTIVLRGVGKITDNSAGSTVNKDGFISGEVIDSIDKKTGLIPALV